MSFGVSGQTFVPSMDPFDPYDVTRMKNETLLPRKRLGLLKKKGKEKNIPTVPYKTDLRIIAKINFY